MNNLRAIADKTAVSLSLLCAIHCLAMPLLVVLMPAIAGMFIADEVFHIWLAFAVIPVSVYALTMGCKKHKRYQLLIIGGIGVAILLSAPIVGHDFLGETWEKILTAIGAVIIAFAHVLNFRECKRHVQCEQ